jgi:hypothetical protein
LRKEKNVFFEGCLWLTTQLPLYQGGKNDFGSLGADPVHGPWSVSRVVTENKNGGNQICFPAHRSPLSSRSLSEIPLKDQKFLENLKWAAVENIPPPCVSNRQFIGFFSLPTGPEKAPLFMPLAVTML